MLTKEPFEVSPKDLMSPRPSLMKRIYEDTMERIEETHNKNSWLSVHAYEEKYKQAVKIYAEYWVERERIDRSYPHTRGEYGIRTIMKHPWFREHIEKLTKLLDDQVASINNLGIDEYEQSAANTQSQDIAQQTLGECHCAQCWRPA